MARFRTRRLSLLALGLMVAHLGTPRHVLAQQRGHEAIVSDQGSTYTLSAPPYARESASVTAPWPAGQPELLPPPMGEVFPPDRGHLQLSQPEIGVQSRVDSLRQFLTGQRQTNLSQAATQNQGAAQDQSAGAGQSTDQAGGFDRQLVQMGQGYFNSSCTVCHDAERATSRMQSYAAWLATVRRMAAKEGADIPAIQHNAIATYLASLNPAAAPAGDGGTDATSPAEALAAAEAAVPSFTLNGTISTVWRGSDPELENKGFFPDVWVGVEWRPPNNPLSGQVMTCTSCHGANEGLGVELVEAAATADLLHLLTGIDESERRCTRFEAELKAGRFIVPFGAFSSRVHPGALRTVSLPLMYNMGRRVGPTAPLQPVINMPYSDEGVNLHLGLEVFHDWSVTLDGYGVNGLQQGGPQIFRLSRSYRDNNSDVAYGGRVTVGNGMLKFGGSLSRGELQLDTQLPREYELAGADFSFVYEDKLRAYYEYAIRVEEATGVPNAELIAYGNLIEMEVLLTCKPKISFLARYDTLEHRGSLGIASTERVTYGLNFLLRGGSLLIVDHEHWIFDEVTRYNIVGVRWTAVF